MEKSQPLNPPQEYFAPLSVSPSDIMSSYYNSVYLAQSWLPLFLHETVMALMLKLLQ